ncbi:MAG: sigma-70 family RNA polymerase sigma factor [Bacteroidales bacterium]|jgi:RNA polymerase sporulation-specific sigma factor|nr:sigma-70 family RNA polymerase sigma factor [Bacteroidales bacterium]
MTRDERDNVILKNRGLVGYLYGRLYKNDLVQCEEENLIGEGYIGLIKAADSFDPSKNFKFATWATRCIQNQFFMYIRKVKKHYENTISMNTPIGTDNEITLEDALGENAEIDNTDELIACLDKAVVKSPKCMRKIIRERKEGKTQKQAAQIVGVSQSYVSRLIKNCKSKFEKEIDR